jgi:hypothetical protein
MTGCGASENFNRAKIRGENIRTMIAMKNVAIALEIYRNVEDDYPTADSMAQLKSQLDTYLGSERGVDRWGNALVVTVTPDSYVLTSGGDDGTGGHEYGGAVETAGHSITMKDGFFAQYHSSVESTAREYEAEIAKVRSRATTGD